MWFASIMATLDRDGRKRAGDRQPSWKDYRVFCLTHLKLYLMLSWQNFFVSQYFSWINLMEKRGNLLSNHAGEGKRSTGDRRRQTSISNRSVSWLGQRLCNALMSSCSKYILMKLKCGLPNGKRVLCQFRNTGLFISDVMWSKTVKHNLLLTSKGYSNPPVQDDEKAKSPFMVSSK